MEAPDDGRVRCVGRVLQQPGRSTHVCLFGIERRPGRHGRFEVVEPGCPGARLAVGGNEVEEVACRRPWPKP